MTVDVLIRIQRAVRESRYRFSDHALDEADSDNLTEEDVLYILLNGDLDSMYSEDPRGVRCGPRRDRRSDYRCSLPFSA